MKKFPFFLFLTFTCLGVLKLSAQSDSIKMQPDSANINIISFNLSSYSDTIDIPVFSYNLPFFYYMYSSVNPLSVYNGNAGSFSLPFKADPLVSENYFLLLPFHQLLLYNSKNIPLYISEFPATNAFYSSGKNKEQHFHVVHSQKIDSCLFFTLNYKLINAPGLYTNQRTKQGHFFGYVIYRHPNNRFNATAGIAQNKILQRENGGIAYPRQFEDSVLYNRQFTSVNFTSAERCYRDVSIFLKQYYCITGKETSFPLYIGYEGDVNFQKNIFSDSDPANNPYRYIFLDSTKTYDSTYISTFSNKVTLSNFSPSGTNLPAFRYWLGFNNSNSKIQQFGNRDIFHNNSIEIGAYLNLSSQIGLSPEIRYFTGPYNVSDYKAGIALNSHNIPPFIKQAVLRFSVLNIHPQYVYQHFYSNHAIWHTDFEAQNSLAISLDILTKFIRFDAGYFSVKNLVYLDEQQFPAQLSEKTGVFHAEISGNYSAQKFYSEGTIGTNLISKDSPYRFPEYYLQLRVGYQFPMFRKALLVFVGAENIWFSEFPANSWSFVTGMLYLQNEVKIGNYQYPGLFLAIKIKRARIFAMVDNITAGLSETNYYAMPSYPRYDRFFRWGISWSFFN